MLLLVYKVYDGNYIVEKWIITTFSKYNMDGFRVKRFNDLFEIQHILAYLNASPWKRPTSYVLKIQRMSSSFISLNRRCSFRIIKHKPLCLVCVSTGLRHRALQVVYELRDRQREHPKSIWRIWRIPQESERALEQIDRHSRVHAASQTKS